MICKTIKYTDFDDEEVTNKFYFGLTKAEIAETELSTSGGIQEIFRKIVAERDRVKMVELFKKIILMSYGEKSDDGLYFLKKDADGRPLSLKFEQSAAYSALYMELVQDTKKALEFCIGILPKDYQKQLGDIDIDALTSNPSKAEAIASDIMEGKTPSLPEKK